LNSVRWTARFKISALIAALLLSCLGFQASAATVRIWNVPAGGNWNTAGNWNPVGVPAAGDTAQISTINAGAIINLTAASNAVILNISTNNSFTISGSALSVSAITDSAAAGTHTISAPVTMTVANIWNISAGVNLAISGVLGGNFNLTKSGAGTATLSGVNTFGGAKLITVSGGILSINADAALGVNTNTLSLSGATLQATATFTSARAIALGGNSVIDVTPAASNLTLSGVISGANSLSKTGPGTLTLTGVNTFGAAGKTVAISGGILSINTDTRLGNAGNSLVIGGGTLQATATLTSARAITVTAGDATFDVTPAASNLTLSGVISGANSLIKTSAGTLTLSGANTFGAAGESVTISGGVLSINADATLGNAANTVNIGGGTLQATATFASARDIAIGAGNATLDVTPAASGLTLSGVISGANALTKISAGTLTLSGANTYFGATSITGGSLLVDGSLAAGSAVTINAGATLGGAGTINGSVTGAGGTLSAGDLVSTTAVLNTGPVSFSATSTLSVQLNSTVVGTGYDQISVTGAVNLANCTLNAAVGYTAAGGDAFTLITSTGALTNTFTGLPNNSTVTLGGQNFVITYTANSVVLTRVVANFTWNGAGGTNNWNLGANWVGGVAPGIGDNLIFGLTGAARKTTNTNNYVAGTTFGSIQFTDSGYTLAGNSVTLNGGPTALNNNFAGANIVNVPLVFATNAPTISCLTGGTLTIGGTINNGGLLLTVDSAGTTTLNGIISGAGGLSKLSAGTLTAPAVNTFGGAGQTVTVSGGVFSVATDTSLGNAANTITLAGGTLTTTATITSARNMTLGAGDGTLNTLAGTTLTLSGVISGGNSLTKTNTGALVLGGAANTFGGAGESLTIAAGSLSVNLGGQLGDPATTLVLGDGTTFTITAVTTAPNPVTLGAGVAGITINVPNNTTSATPIVMSGPIAGGAAGQILNVTGASDAWLLLSGASSYIANIIMANAVNLEFTSDSSFGDPANTLTMTNNNAIASVGGTTFAGNRAIVVNNSFFLSSAGTFWVNGGVVSGTNLNVGYSDASGAFTGTVELSGNNTFGGTIAVRCGTLALANNNALGLPTTITMNGAAFNSALANAALMIDGNVTIPQNITTTANGASTNTIGSLSGTTGTFSGTVTMGSNTFFTAATGSTVTFSNTISGAFSVTAGSGTANGTLYFTPPETYTGATIVNGGILRLKGDTATLATIGLTLNFGGTFDIDASGTLNPNRIPAADTITFNGGTFSMSAPPNVDRTETVTQLLFNTGDSTIALTPNGTGRAQLASTSAFARNAGATLSYMRNTGGGTGLAHVTSTAQAAGPVNYATVTTGAVTSASTYDTTNAADAMVNGLTFAAPVFTSQANTDWNTAATWTPAGPPTAGSVAVVQNAVTVNNTPANVPLSIVFKSGGSLTTTAGVARTLTVGAGGLVVNSGAAATIGGGAIALSLASSTTELVVVTAGTGTMAINNPILNTNTPALTKSGTGTLTLNAVNAYTGATTINNGTLLVDGSTAAGSAVSLNGGTLGGTGTVNGTVTSTAQGGNISPGDPSGNPGILRTGAVTLNVAAELDLQINGPNVGTDYDQLNVAGAINLGSSTLSATIGAAYLPANGTSFTIISSTGAVSGTFLGLANNAVFPISGQNFRITYNANSVVLTRVIATYTWNGAGINNNWSTGFNWAGGVAPGIADSLLFGAAGAARKTTDINNIAAGTSFNSIQFQSAGYVLNGNNVVLTGGANALNYSATAGTNTINNNIAFASNAPTISCIAGGNLIVGGTLDNGGLLLTLASAGTTTLNGVISNTGDLASTGTGTAILSVNNTYTGATTISAGTLQVGNNGTTGSLGTGAITDNGTLAFKRTNALTVATAISGTGNVTQAGSGTLTLTAANSYSGTTTISAGTLQVGNNGITGTLGTGAISDNASLVFNRSDAITIATVIGGTGNVSQAGSGTLTLTAAETYTGTTTVSAGVLVFNGSLPAGAGLTTVNSGATLGGSGTLRALTVANGGILAPGVAGIATINSGNLTLSAGAQYNVDINSATSDQDNVTGTVNISGSTININTLAGFAPTAGAVLTVINNDAADAVTGTFTGMPEGSLLLTNGYGFQISYVGGTGNDVVLKHVPIVASITRADTNPTNAPQVNFTVTFSEPVQNVATADFAVAVTGGLAGSSVQSVAAVGAVPSATWTVTVNTGTITANGTLQLNLVDRDTITDSASVKLGGVGIPPPAGGAGDGSFTGSIYTIHYFVATAELTQDRNINGFLDTIKITTNLNLNDDFSGLTMTATVGAYTYSLAATPYGTDATSNDNVFIINLAEQVGLPAHTGDTGNLPVIALTANTTLSENGASGVLLRVFSATAVDGAAPVLTASQWNDGGGSSPGVDAADTITLYFSENVVSLGAVIADIGTAVTGDSLSTSTIPDAGPSTQLTINLGGSPVLSPGGTYISGVVAAGSPSGLYVANGSHIKDVSPAQLTLANTTIPTAVDLLPGGVVVACCWNDFTILPKLWNLGTVDLGQTFTANPSFPPIGLTVVNSGNVRSQITIQCSGSAPTGWALGAAPAADTFSMKADASSPLDGVYELDLSAGPQPIVTKLFSGMWKTFDLQFQTPTQLTGGAGIQQTITVTIVITQN
jgi:fibronectin-binding autotransporter adhesin